jgi:hypothetical protein
MPLSIAIGQARALDARDAGLQAANQALNRSGTNQAALGLVIASHRYDPQQVMNGISSLTGNLPLIGFSTSMSILQSELVDNQVILALISGESLRSEVHWVPAYAQSSQDAAVRLNQLLAYEQDPAQCVLVFADGFNGDADEFCNGIPGHIPVMGALASGDPHTGISYQMSGNQTGSSSLTAAFLRGNIQISAGYAHGWKPIGMRFRVTRSRGFWLRTLDGRPASETYAQLFGYPAREWAFPPLNHLARLYPLGLEQGNNRDLIIRAPLRVEADGSFRLNAPVRDGNDVYLLSADRFECLEAARQAAQTALQKLENATPAFALVLVDTAWQTLFQAQPGAEIDAIRDVIGTDIPIIGGYTLGQIAPTPEDNEAPPKFLNQHIQILLFADSAPQA